MIVLKFGGTSMGSAERIVNSAAIICGRAAKSRVGVVVSAVAGVSNRLQESIDRCLAGKDPGFFIESLTEIHAAITRALALLVSGFDVSAVAAKQKTVLEEYARLLQATAAFGECPDSVYCRIMGMGEMLSAPMIQEVIRAKGYGIEFLDSRRFITTSGSLTEGEPVTEAIAKAFEPYKNGGAPILLMTGFVCSHTDGRTSLLGRNGSDFSAALMAMGLNAQKLEIWTDVDGIYTADPRIVPEAVLIDEMSYEEAMELSFFGSKVLHPKTIAPLAANRIETWSLNSFNPGAKGTRIAAGPFKQSGPVRGISSLKKVAVITVSGAGMKGRAGMAARIFSTVSRQSVSILLITQSSSEYTITFCVRESDTVKTKAALEEEFALEQREHLLNPLDICGGRAIISIVGDGMKKSRGLAATFFDALASAGVNIHAIAQGYSERSISAVIDGDDSDKAVLSAHRFLFAPVRTVGLCVFGTGRVGRNLLEQIHLQKEELSRRNIDIRVLCIADSHSLLLDKDGIDLDNWETLLHASGDPPSLDQALSFVTAANPLNPVFADCTASNALVARYGDIFAAGLHIVTANEYVNVAAMDDYRLLRHTAGIHRRLFFYETTAGGGLPVLGMLRDMVESGDSLISLCAVASGALSYVFGQVEDGVPFSKAVAEAGAKGLFDGDLCGALSGDTAARTALAMAREAGISCEWADVRIEPVLPAGCAPDGCTAETLEQLLPSADAWYAERAASLKAQGKVLRHVVAVTASGGCTAGVREIDRDDPLFTVKAGETAFVYMTKRYSPQPLVIRGTVSAAAAAAAGVFSGILRTITWRLR